MNEDDFSVGVWQGLVLKYLIQQERDLARLIKLLEKEKAEREVHHG